MHHGDIEPPLELASDLALDPDEFESACSVESPRGVARGLDPGDDRVEAGRWDELACFDGNSDCGTYFPKLLALLIVICYYLYH